MESFKLGCEALVDDPPPWLGSARLGLLVNQASVSSGFEPASAMVRRAGGRLACLFTPQHGFHSEKQANMIESGDDWESSLDIPVFSLYGEVRRPTPAMLERIDVLLIDLQDVGTRVYTYASTMGLCMEEAARAGVRVAVLDRPNPLGGAEIEGNLVREDHLSFVGLHPIPMRHGLTMGELALYIRQVRGVDCELEVIPMKGWRRSALFPELGVPWVFPSPNMPSWETALVYPGMVLFEGTNVSEGRGTTLPFQIFGAPFVDPEDLLKRLGGSRMDGVALRPVTFEPVFDKWRGEVCRGLQLHVVDPRKVRPYRLGLALLQAIAETCPEHFRWLPPPYEYEWEKLPIDILIGDGALRRRLEEGAPISALEEGWREELSRYRELREGVFLYR